MNVLEHERLVKEIETYLFQAIENLPKQRANTLAENIVQEFTDATDFSTLIVHERKPLRDKENLQLSVKRIQLAIKALNKVGTIGQIEISKAFSDDDQPKRQARGINQIEYLMQELRVMADRLKIAYSTIDETHPGAIAILGNSTESVFTEKKTENWIAKKITKIAADIFEKETSFNATLTNTSFREDNEAKGRFFTFLKGLFEILKIDAQGEANIKKLRYKSYQKN